MRIVSQSPLRDEQGIALLIAIVLLLLISGVGVTALQHAQSENVAGSSSRRKLGTLYAADSLLQLVTLQLVGGQTQFPNTAALDQPDFIANRAGVYTSARESMTSSVRSPCTD